MPSRRQLANAIRFLSMDAVQAANSGHPGAPLGMADIAEVLWNDHLRHNPANPRWPDRDRFVLSNGHGSMLLYSLLHLSGYDLPLEELKQFRQLHSRTAGHPEYGHTPGVETTTGPLGQGLTNAVGMAIAERTLAAQFNRPGHEIVNHHTYVFLGDGCLMEGISHEACSLAGTLGLGKLIAVYDDNGISIDGDIAGWFGDDTPTRFQAYGWHVLPGIDGHDPDAINAALDQARAVTDKPSLLCCKTVIGYGAPNKAGGHDVHGAPLGNDEIAAARQHLDWPHAPFVIPDEIYAGWDARIRGRTLETEWQQRFNAYRAAYPELAAEFERRTQGHLPTDFAAQAAAYQQAAQEKGDTIASRVASQRALNAYGPVLPELLGGSADLTPSNNTTWSGSRIINADPGHQRPGARDGNYLHYGVREFGMGAIMNGIALHGGFIPYGGTFLVFSDYARSSLRMAALMRIRSLFVLTHDSIGLGEDGPTHQPVEHIASLRLIPHLHVWRPGDAVETAVAWQAALERRDGPAVLALSRQNLPAQPRTPEQVQAIHQGGYILLDPQDGAPDAIVMATGSELGLAMQAAQTLNAQGRRVRVVSLPCLEVFEQQDQGYRDHVLPPAITARVAIEAGVSGPWYRYVGSQGRIVALDRFGESAPAGKLFEYFGFTAERVVKTIEELL